MRDRLSHCLDLNIYLPEGTAPPVNSTGLILLIGSVTCCGLWKIKGWVSCLKRYRAAEKHTSPTVAPREHAGFGSRFKVKGEQLWDIWLNPCGSSIIPLQIQVLHCQHIWEGRCLTQRQISMLEGGQAVFWGSLINEGCRFSPTDLRSDDSCLLEILIVLYIMTFRE